jgi:agmatinase
LAVIQVDAHIDTWDTYFGMKYTHGSFMRRSIEEGLVDTAHTIQVGIRGALFKQQDWSEVHEFGMEILTMDAVSEWPVERTVSAIRHRVGAAPVYITFDIDGVDPAFCPGTGAPEVGGLTSQQTIAILNGLAGLNVVGADVVEVIPAYDPTQITALFAARVGYELLGLIACHRRAQEHERESTMPRF